MTSNAIIAVIGPTATGKTALAVELAEEHGQTLVGFLRGKSGRVYADDGRMRGSRSL